MEVAQESLQYTTESTLDSADTPPGESSVPSRRIGGLSGFHHRRMSGVHTLSAFEDRKFPITDEASLQKFDSLLEQFPKAPTNLEPNRPPSTNTSSKQGWGLKGFAERFFSK